MCPCEQTLENLHVDIIITILLRLPIKYLFRCLAVCKLFRTVIKSRSFIDLKNQSTIQEDAVFMYQYPHKTTLSSYIETSHTRNYYSFYDQTFTTKVDLQFPFHTSTSTKMTVQVGCCRGLLCLKDYYKFYLWNPTIRMCKMVDLHYRESSHKPYVVLGFGYAQRANDFKVVRIKKGESTGERKFQHEVDVYTLSTNSWRRIDNIVSGRFELYPTAIVNGVVHWHFKASSDENSQGSNYILGFCLDDEVFHEIAVPENNYLYYRVVEYRGLLSINCYRDKVRDVWMLKDYGNVNTWSKVFTFAHNNNGLWLMKNDSTFLLRTELGKYSICDRRSGQAIKEIEPNRFSDLPEIDHSYTVVFNYEESLALFNPEEKPKHKEEQKEPQLT